MSRRVEVPPAQGQRTEQVQMLQGAVHNRRAREALLPNQEVGAIMAVLPIRDIVVVTMVAQGRGVVTIQARNIMAGVIPAAIVVAAIAAALRTAADSAAAVLTVVVLAAVVAAAAAMVAGVEDIVKILVSKFISKNGIQ